MTEFDAALVPHARRPSPSPELDEVRFHAERLIALVDRLRDNRFEESTHGVLARLLRQARHHPHAVCASLAVFPLPVEQREFRQALSVLVDGNPRARVLLPREFAVDDAVSGPNSLTGAEVRVHGSPLSTVAVVDGRIALLAVDRTLVVLQDHQAVQAVRTLLDSVWDNALDVNSVRWVDVAWPEGGIHRRVLRLLSAGHTDDVASRRLGMSVRTYRRHVAELMTGLEARSRFHAGVLAAQLGLVRPAARRPRRRTAPTQAASGSACHRTLRLHMN